MAAGACRAISLSALRQSVTARTSNPSRRSADANTSHAARLSSTIKTPGCVWSPEFVIGAAPFVVIKSRDRALAGCARHHPTTRSPWVGEVGLLAEAAEGVPI